ncbi:hypothetical protein L195_g049098, partial [Trifolium pratense]
VARDVCDRPVTFAVLAISRAGHICLAISKAVRVLVLCPGNGTRVRLYELMELATANADFPSIFVSQAGAIVYYNFDGRIRRMRLMEIHQES